MTPTITPTFKPLSNTDIQIILAISFGWNRNASLADYCQISIAAITQKVDNLEKVGIVYRENSGNQTEYRLTANGAKLVKDAYFEMQISLAKIYKETP